VKVGEVSVERAKPQGLLSVEWIWNLSLISMHQMKPPLCMVLVRSGIAYVRNKSSKNC
jgi:hypothetical protein